MHGTKIRDVRTRPFYLFIIMIITFFTFQRGEIVERGDSGK